MIRVHDGRISKRTWTYEGKKHCAYGYSLTVDEGGKRRRYRKQFATRAVEEQLKRLEAGVKKLTFNGNRLSIENAADMRAVPLGALLRRKLISSLGAMRPHRQIC